MMRIVILAITSLVFSGCATAPPVASYNYIREPHQPDTTEHRVERSYILDQVQTVAVGDVMIRVRDYNVTTKHLGTKLIPTENFTIYGATALAQGIKGSPLSIDASAVIDDVEYTVFKVKNSSMFGGANAYWMFFVRASDGQLKTDLIRMQIAGNQSNTPAKLRIEPAGTRFVLESEVQESAETKGSVNYELIYTGSSKEQMNFKYREYTSADLAREPFFQDLTYSRSESSFRFRDLRIRVDSISNEGITFAVTEDGS